MVTASQAISTTFFSLWDLWLFSYKQGYFWTATASSLSLPWVKEAFLFWELLFCFYMLPQVFFHLSFLLIYKKIISSYRNVFFNISWEQFLSALSYVIECEINASVEIVNIFLTFLRAQEHQGASRIFQFKLNVKT